MIPPDHRNNISSMRHEEVMQKTDQLSEDLHTDDSSHEPYKTLKHPEPTPLQPHLPPSATQHLTTHSTGRAKFV